MEPTFAKIRSETLDLGRIPTLSQTAWLAEFCLGLYFRSPRFKRLADRFYDTQDCTEAELKVLKDHGARTLALTIGEVIKRCAFNLIQAVGNEHFWTSDTPCWQWHRDGKEWKATNDLAKVSPTRPPTSGVPM